MPDPTNPLIAQSDKTVLIEVDNPRYEAARDALARFCELVKAPEHIHTYRITPLSLWNAAAAGVSAAAMIETLNEYGKWELPANVRADLLDAVDRYGRVKLEKIETDGGDSELRLTSEDDILITEIEHHKQIQPFLLGRPTRRELTVDPARRGHLKQALLKIGFPVEDLAGYVEGSPLEIALCDTRENGQEWHLRDYQKEAVALFWAGGAARGGSGVIVLPCGAGKTMVGLGAMAQTAAQTLIICTNTVAARQWMTEIADKTTVPEEAIGEYSGEKKEIKPVTVTTYQCLSYRKRASKKKKDAETNTNTDTDENEAAEFPHLDVFGARNWGLIIYDEVHLLPAPVFRVTAELQARRRLGLTATLVREDGREDDVFSLIGPKKYDVPWRELEKQGWIAQAICHEIRLRLPESRRMEYAVAETREKYGIAARNEAKIEVAEQLVERHRDDNVLIIGQYIEQLEAIAAHFEAPLITGAMKNRDRQALYDRFRRGEEKLLVVSKVANFSLDLPEANVAIQVSGTFGSRQEEAQRLGRILRPKEDGGSATFYTLVTRDTRDAEFAANRQMFLTEQGYRYEISDGVPETK